MRKPPRPPSDNQENAIIEALKKMGIRAHTVRMVDRFGNEVDFHPERTDNVIPFPKSSRPLGQSTPFGKRSHMPHSPFNPPMTAFQPMEVLASAAENLRQNPAITGCLVLMLEGDNPNGSLICYQAGLTKYEAVGMIEDAKHDIVCGMAGPFDDTPFGDGAA